MDDAFDTLKHQPVRAVDASSSHFRGRYICPVCQAEVLHVSGDQVSPYFRHWWNSERDECERYCRSFNNEPLSCHVSEHLDAVLVARDSAPQGSGSVCFAVRFRPAYPVNSVSFTSAKTSIPYTIHRNIRQQYFQISRPEENYLVTAHLKDGKCASHIVEGFGEKPAVFRESERESVRLPSHRTLRPGGYIVISKQALQHRFHVSLVAESRPTIPGLYATFIKIPEDPGWDIQSNVRSLLGFQINSVSATYAFLSPLVVSELATDCWEIARNEAACILVRLSGNRSAKVSQLLIQRQHVGDLSSDYLSLSEVGDSFVVRIPVIDDGPDLYRIGLADPPEFLLEIRRSSDPIDPECARLLFHFSMGAKGRQSFSWSAHELAEALVDLSRGNAELVSIKKPNSIQIQISDHTRRLVSIPEIAAERELTDFLRRARFPCILSATGYPPLKLRRERAYKRSPRPARRVSNVLPQSRHEARLLDAFNRRRVSSYAIRFLSQ
jgi:hypothetical protein